MTTPTNVTTITKSGAPIRKGVVVSNRMQKTLVVSVDTLKSHPKYGKRYISTKRYKVHYETGEYAIGDTVHFRECPPKSKDKRHIIVTKEKTK